MNTILAQATSNSAGGVFFGFGIFSLLLGLLFFVIWLYALFSAATRTDIEIVEKVIWLLLIFFLPVLGLILYFLIKGRGR